jgi:preprotein translocase subunit YajC
MKDETKSSVKTIVIALLIMAAVFFALYKMDQANMHSHDGGAAHSH